MTLAVVHSRALDVLAAPEVRVEVHLANGLPSFTLVGLADTEVKEARERVRAALLTCGFEFPHNRRITVNLAPADLPKESGRFDLPIALGVLAASGVVPLSRLEGFEFAGELSLAGELRPVRGALAMALAVRRAGTSRTLVLPIESAREAALVAGLALREAGHLLEVVHSLMEGPDVVPLPPPPVIVPSTAPAGLDLADVRGQGAAKRVLEIAAAGGHSLLMVGPPGSGKSMLAQRLVGLMPPLTEAEALESAAVRCLGSGWVGTSWGERVMRAPHHSASAPALVGGGSPPRPGEISLAHQGVLFLDELPEFPRRALEALREPLESGRIVISRAARQAEFPARFILVAAMNPCPCGHHGSATQACRCTPDNVARYQGRISGPLLDRIDLTVEVTSVAPAELSRPDPQAEPSALVALRVAAARERALARQGELNARLEADALDRFARPERAALEFLQKAALRLAWSARGFHRVQRVARTIADLAGSEAVETAHVAEAIQYRRALVSP